MFAIKKMREKAGYKQQDVADKLDVTIRCYGNWEREDREINLRDAIRLADLFECSLDELAGREWHGSETPSLSVAEHDIVDAYRKSDERGKGNILDVAKREKIASAGDVVPVGDGVR